MSLENYKGKVLLLLLGLALVRGLIYSAVVLPWQAPDEPRHFEYVKLLYKHRRLVGWADVDPSIEEEIIASMAKYDFWTFGLSDWTASESTPLPQRFHEVWTWPGTQHELHQPPLSYLLYLVPLLVTAGEGTAMQLYALRIVSVIMGTMVVLVGYLTARELFPNDKRLVIAISAFVVFLPMHTFMTSTVNNDHLAELLVSMVILAWARSFRTGLSYRRVIVIVFLAFLGMLAKRTAIVAIPICMFAMLLYLWGRNIRTLLSWRRVCLAVGLLAGVGGILVVGLTGWSRLAALVNKVSSGETWLLDYYFALPSERFPFSFDQPYLSTEAVAVYRSYILLMFESFWARFGWANIRLSAVWYAGLAIASVAAFLGLGLAAVRLRGTRTKGFLSGWRVKLFILLVISILFDFVIIVAKEIRSNWEITMRGWPNGRYLYPVIIPIATLFVVGLRELFSRRFGDQWWYVYIGGLILFDTVSLMLYIMPFFYGIAPQLP